MTGIDFKITSNKVYVSEVTLSINKNIKLLYNIKYGLKGTVSWNKYISEITTEPKTNHLDDMIDPKFRTINKLFID